MNFRTRFSLEQSLIGKTITVQSWLISAQGFISSVIVPHLLMNSADEVLQGSVLNLKILILMKHCKNIQVIQCSFVLKNKSQESSIFRTLKCEYTLNEFGLWEPYLSLQNITWEALYYRQFFHLATMKLMTLNQSFFTFLLLITTKLKFMIGKHTNTFTHFISHINFGCGACNRPSKTSILFNIRAKEGEIHPLFHVATYTYKSRTILKLFISLPGIVSYSSVGKRFSTVFK